MRQARDNYRTRDILWILANTNSKQRIKREDIYSIPLLDKEMAPEQYPELTERDRKFAKVAAQKLRKVV